MIYAVYRLNVIGGVHINSGAYNRNGVEAEFHNNMR
jgi:hypothetical protein